MNNTIEALKQKLVTSNMRLASLESEKAKEEARIKEINQMIDQEKSKIITDFKNGDVFKYYSNSYIMVIPYGFQTTFEEQLYWWVDTSLLPFSTSTPQNGMTKEVMLKNLNELPSIRFHKNVLEDLRASIRSN